MAKETSRNEIAALSQTNATWHVTVRRAPAWITPKNQPPYRPYLILVLDAQNGRIRQTAIKDDRPTPETVLEVLTQAMTRPVPGGGKRCRPARLVLDRSDMVSALAPRLLEMGIRCDYQATSAMMAQALRSLESSMNRGQLRPSLMRAAGVTVPLIAELFEAAAEFYRQAPWRWLDNLMPIEYRYPADGPARYLVVMGSGGEEFGLAFYASLDDLRLQYGDHEPEELYKKITALAITFDEPMALAYDDLDALEEYGWPVAGPHAYPLPLKAVPPAARLVPLNADEVAAMAACLRAVPPFVNEHLRTEAGPLRAAQATFPLPGVHAGRQIALRYPVDLPDVWTGPSAGQLDEAELEQMIEHWYWDEPSHVFARQTGAFLLRFLDFLESQRVPERALRKHEQNCWAIGKLVCKHGGHTAFTPSIFLGPPAYLDEFRREFSASPDAVTSYKITWRRLGEFVREWGYD